MKQYSKIGGIKDHNPILDLPPVIVIDGVEYLDYNKK